MIRRRHEILPDDAFEGSALIVHDGAAERVDLEMQEAKLLVFCSPTADTPLGPWAAGRSRALEHPRPGSGSR